MPVNCETNTQTSLISSQQIECRPLYVNNMPIELAAGEQLNCIQAAQRVGVEIPHYCWHPALSVVASCRMCLVEVGEKKPDGTVAMQPKLVPGCQTPVKDGMVDRLRQREGEGGPEGDARISAARTIRSIARRATRRASACCRTTASDTAAATAGWQEPKQLKPDKDHIGEQITLFTDRCIMCTRCVRFTREISGTAELQVINRGARRGDRHLSRRAVQQQAGRQRGRPLPGRRPVQQGFSVQAAGVVAEDRPRACARNCSTGCSINVDRERGPASTACGRGRIRRRRATSCATRAGSAGSTFTAISGSRCPSIAQRRQA